MRILVTGGLGYFGAILTRYLVGCGHDVYTLSLRDRDVLRNLGFTRLFADVRDIESLRHVVTSNDFDAVVHLASINETSAHDYARRALEINALGTRNVLQSFVESNKKPHFVYLSTFHVYGSVGGLITEETSTWPMNDYGTTHLFGEFYTKQFWTSAEVPFTILRLTNGYGCPLEKESSKWYLLLNDLCRMAVKKREIRLNSNGSHKRDFVWLEDAARVVEACIQKGPANDVFNLAGDNVRSIREVADLVSTACCLRFGFQAPVYLNQDDMSVNEPSIRVGVEKIKRWVKYFPKDNMVFEAEKILDFVKLTI